MWVVNATPRPLFTPGKDTVPIVQEAGWAPGPVWTGTENLAFKGIRSPDGYFKQAKIYTVNFRVAMPHDTRWFKYDRECLHLFTHKSVPVIFEPPCI